MRIDSYEVQNDRAVAVYVSDERRNMKQFRYEQARPRGEWIEVPKYKGYYVCSECLKRLDGDFERFEHWEMRKDNFCNVCGSDNRKKEGD